MARESERVAYVFPSVPFQQKLPHHVSRRVGTQRVVDLRAQVIPRCLWLDRPRHGLHRLKQLERHVLIPRDLVRHDARDVDRTQQEQRLFVLRLVDRVGVNLTVQKRGQVDQANGFRAGRVRRQGAPLGGGKIDVQQDRAEQVAIADLIKLFLSVELRHEAGRSERGDAKKDRDEEYDDDERHRQGQGGAQARVEHALGVLRGRGDGREAGGIWLN